MDTQQLVYRCGCVLAEVGQHFERGGILVCPIHHQETIPLEQGPPTFHGRVQLELRVTAESRERVQRWLDTLVETLLAEDIVTGLDVAESGS